MDLLLLTCTRRPDRAFSDLDRACILARSLERYLDPGDAWTIHVVAADREMQEVQDRLSRYRLTYAFHSHSDLLPGPWPKRGWRLQQIIKLLAHSCIASPFFLSIDSDHILTRPLCETDIVMQGRGIFTPALREEHESWWTGSAEILGTGQAQNPVTANTCVCLAITVVEQLVDALRERLGGGWAHALLAREDWAEYALYFTLLQSLAPTSRFHFEGPLLGYAHTLWRLDQVERWAPEDAFNKDHFFIAIQSYLNIPPDMIRDMTAPYLGPWPE